MKFSKQLVAALIAAVLVTGVAYATQNNRILEAKKVITEQLVVGDSNVDRATGSVSVSGNLTGPVPTTEVVVAAATITANACGGIKNISSASAVTTGTTNTFTAPSAANAGCIMQVCNVNASDAITLDDNALFNASGIGGATPGDTVLGALDCVSVGSTGTVWNQLAPGSQN